MKDYNGFNPNTAQFVIKALAGFKSKILEHKIYLMQSTVGIDPKLVTKSHDDDLYTIDWVINEIKKDSTYLRLEENDPQYIKAGLLSYKNDLIKAKKIASTLELENEIKETERILEIELIKNANSDIFDKYYKTRQKSVEKNFSDEVSELINEIENLNVFSKTVLKCKIFGNNAKLLNDLRGNTKTAEDFTHRITTIGSIINDVFFDDIKKRINKKDVEGSINLIQTLLDENSIKYDKEAIIKLRNLYRLRNTKQPIHNGEHEAIIILKDLGIAYPINYIEAGEKLVRHFLEAIKSLNSTLGQSIP